MTDMSPFPSDPMRPPTAPNAPSGWRPMSGLAITALIASIVLGVVAFFWWWAAVVPLALSLLAVVKAVPARFRGRGLAIAGVVVSLLFGSCAFMAHATFRTLATDVTEELLRPLAATDLDEAERDHRLKDWVTERAVEEGVLDHVKARFAAVVERLGPYQGNLRAGSTFSGILAVMGGPRDGGLAQVDDEEATTLEVLPGSALWSVASFERGDVHVALFLGDPQDATKLQQALAAGSKTRVVKDLRFYVPRP